MSWYEVRVEPSGKRSIVKHKGSKPADYSKPKMAHSDVPIPLNIGKKNGSSRKAHGTQDRETARTEVQSRHTEKPDIMEESKEKPEKDAARKSFESYQRGMEDPHANPFIDIKRDM